MPRYEPVGQSFYSRLHALGLSLFRREIKEGFRRLSTFRYGTAHRLVAWMKHLRLEVQEEIAFAVTKRMYPKRLGIPEATMTESEQSIIAEFLRVNQAMTAEEMSFQERRLAGVGLPEVKRSNFSKRVLAELQTVFEHPAEPVLGGSEWRYYVQFGNWTVTTSVSCGARSRHLAYFHRLHEAPVDPRSDAALRRQVAEDISLFSIMGISAQSEWRHVLAEDAMEVSHLLASLCREFLEQVPGLLEAI